VRRVWVIVAYVFLAVCGGLLVRSFAVADVWRSADSLTFVSLALGRFNFFQLRIPPNAANSNFHLHFTSPTPAGYHTEGLGNLTRQEIFRTLRYGGFSFERQRSGIIQSDGFSIPLWFPMLLIGGMLAWGWWRRKRKTGVGFEVLGEAKS
jgi:hypothetical protein